MYNFSIPDSYYVRTINKALLYAMRDYPEWFYKDFIIETAYGCPGGCIWNGNRIEGDIIHLSNWKTILAMYSDFHISYRLTFTNFLLQPEHLYDTFANKIAEIHNQQGGYVMVSIRLMANYMQRYPNLKVCWSTTTDFGKGQDEIIDRINELSENTLVVLPYELNNTSELDRLEHPENLEVLINEGCIDNCPRRRQHWTECNEVALYMAEGNAPCVFEGRAYEGPRKHHIHRDMLSYYAVKGINHFKISGRLDASQAVAAYLEYFTLPEFYKDFTDYFIGCNESNFGQGWNTKIKEN